MVVGELLAKLGLDDREFKSGLAGAKSEAQKSGKGIEDALGKSSKNATSKIADNFSKVKGIVQGTIVAAAAIGAAALVAKLASASLTVAGDFEAGMNRFSAVTGSAVEDAGMELNEFRSKFLRLGADTQFSAAQAQNAAIALAKGGIAVGDIMQDALSETLSLAAAGELELAPAAEIVSKQLGVWASEGVRAGEVSNLLAQAANASTVDVDELAIGLANVGGIAKATGLSFEETVTTMALLAPNFSSAADAGTSLKTMLARLQPTTAAQAEAMGQLNLLSAEGKSLFFDQSGAFIGMEAASQLLADSLADLSEEQKSAALMALFGQDAFRAGAALAEAGSEGYNAMSLAMSNAGSAADQAAKRQMGWNFATESLMGSIETAQIQIGSLMIPMMIAFVEDALIPAVNALSSFAEGLYLAAGGQEELYAKGQALFDFLSSLFLPTITGVGTAAFIAYAGSITTATTALGTHLIALGAAVAPYAAIAAAIGGVVWAVQNYQAKMAEANLTMLESREWWATSTAQIQEYGSATGELGEKLAPFIERQQQLRDSIQEQTLRLAERMQMGTITTEQYNMELEAINAQVAGLELLNESNANLAAQLIANQAASMTATEGLNAMEAGQQRVAAQTVITVEELEKLKGAQETLFQQGASHLQQMYDSRVETEAMITSAQEGGFDEREIAQLSHQAAVLQAQRAHLGSMLSEYTVNQVMMGNITQTKGDEILATLTTMYGQASTASASSFMEMAGHIDTYGSDAGGSLSDLRGDLSSTESQFYETSASADDMARARTLVVLSEVSGALGGIDAVINELSGLRDKTVTITTVRREIHERVDREAGIGSGPHALGLDNVPYDNYLARLHRGEKILTSREAAAYREAQRAGVPLGSSVVNNHYHLNASYSNYQSEGSLRDDVRLMQLLA